MVVPAPASSELYIGSRGLFRGERTTQTSETVEPMTRSKAASKQRSPLRTRRSLNRLILIVRGNDDHLSVLRCPAKKGERCQREMQGK